MDMVEAGMINSLLLMPSHLNKYISGLNSQYVKTANNNNDMLKINLFTLMRGNVYYL